MKVVIVLPTYNERENIKLIIPQLALVAKEIAKKYKLEVLVVDDHSLDGTSEEVKTLAKKYPFVSLLTGEKRGLGMAYVRGMNHAIHKMRANILFEMDADLQHDPKLIPEFLKAIEKGADFVIGSRYIKGGSIPKEWALHRKIFSVFGNLIIRFGLFIPSIHEWTNGYRAFRSEVFAAVGEGLSKFPGYTFQVAFMHRVYQAKFTIVETPFAFGDRTWGESKIIPLEYMYNLVRYIIIHSTFMRYLYVGGLGFFWQMVTLYILVLKGVFPGIAAALGAEVAILWNFILNNAWTFSHSRIAGKRQLFHKFIKFQTASIGAIIIQFIVVSLVALLFDSAKFLGQEIFKWANIFSIIFLVIPYNFFIYNRFIWRTHER